MIWLVLLFKWKGFIWKLKMDNENWHGQWKWTMKMDILTNWQTNQPSNRRMIVLLPMIGEVAFSTPDYLWESYSLKILSFLFFFPSLFLSPPFHAELRRWIKGSFQIFRRTNIYDQEEEWIYRRIEEDKKEKKKKKVKKKSLETEFWHNWQNQQTTKEMVQNMVSAPRCPISVCLFVCLFMQFWKKK